MEIRQKIHNNEPVATILGRMGHVQACSATPGGPLDSLVVHVSRPGLPTLPICLMGNAPLELLNLLLAARERCPELFKE